ncbi:hypothetical protein D5086_024032 [Populus alba]|uniref:Uncharacterized protein n=1 Tax=Populus alba TaxID=43335 RepID=A0ACC4B4A1_POPAL
MGKVCDTPCRGGFKKFGSYLHGYTWISLSGKWPWPHTHLEYYYGVLDCGFPFACRSEGFKGSGGSMKEIASGFLGRYTLMGPH